MAEKLRPSHLGSTAAKSDMANTITSQNSAREIIALAKTGIIAEPGIGNILGGLANGFKLAFKMMCERPNMWGMNGIYTPEVIDEDGEATHPALQFHPRVGFIDMTNATDRQVQTLRELGDDVGSVYLITSLQEGEDKNGNVLPACTLQRSGHEARQATNTSDSIKVSSLMDKTIKMLLKKSGMTAEEFDTEVGNIVMSAESDGQHVYEIMAACQEPAWKAMQKQFTQTEWFGHFSQYDSTEPLQKCIDLRREYLVERVGYRFIIDPPTSGTKDTLNKWKILLENGPDYKHSSTLKAHQASMDESLEKIRVYWGDHIVNAKAGKGRPVAGVVVEFGPRIIETDPIDTPHLTTEGDE